MSGTVLYVDIRESHAVNLLSRKRKQPWYWVLRNSNNNKVMAVSSERYTNRQDCVDAAKLVNGSSVTVYLRAGDAAAILRSGDRAEKPIP